MEERRVERTELYQKKCGMERDIVQMRKSMGNLQAQLSKLKNMKKTVFRAVSII